LTGGKLLAPCSQGGRAGHWGGDAHRLGVAQVGVNRGDHNARLDRDQIDPNQGDSDPSIDDDTLVENSVKDIDEAGAAWGSFNGRHRLDSPLSWSGGRRSLD